MYPEPTGRGCSASGGGWDPLWILQEEARPQRGILTQFQSFSTSVPSQIYETEAKKGRDLKTNPE